MIEDVFETMMKHVASGLMRKTNSDTEQLEHLQKSRRLIEHSGEKLITEYC